MRSLTGLVSLLIISVLALPAWGEPADRLPSAADTYSEDVGVEAIEVLD